MGFLAIFDFFEKFLKFSFLGQKWDFLRFLTFLKNFQNFHFWVKNGIFSDF